MPPRRESSERPTTVQMPPGTYLPISPTKYQRTTVARLRGGAPSATSTGRQASAIATMPTAARKTPSTSHPTETVARLWRTCDHCCEILIATKITPATASAVPKISDGGKRRRRRAAGAPASVLATTGDATGRHLVSGGA